jgi:hypothetical protein
LKYVTTPYIHILSSLSFINHTTIRRCRMWHTDNLSHINKARTKI